VLAVADRAGVAAGTLYRHFSSKEELFVELFRSVCDHELAVMRAAASGGELSAVERIDRVLTTFAMRALSRPRLARALIAEPVAAGVDAERLVYRARYRELLAGALRDGVVLTSAALVGGCAEALIGPLAAQDAPREHTIAALRAFIRRAVGA